MPLPLSASLAAFLESGISVQVGTADAAGQPEGMRALGARAEPCCTEVTVFVPDATSARTLANLRENPRIAVCFSRPRDHRSVQIKGRVTAVAPAAAVDRQRIERYRHGLAEELAWLGLPERLTLRVTWWPCHAIRLEVESIYDQTPGPGAGAKLARSEP